MNEKMTSLDHIKADLKRQISVAEKQIALWENVNRVFKKDGGDFQSLGRNFTNCHLEHKGWGLADNMALVVSEYTQDGGYVKDLIDLMAPVENMKEKPSSDRIKKVDYLKPYVILTPSEIERAISDRIGFLEKRLASYRSQFILADKAYEAFTEAIDRAVSDLKNIAGYGTTLYFGCRNYMKYTY